MIFPKKIETEDLILKKPSMNSDFIKKLNNICSGEKGEKITKMMLWSPHSNIKETEEVIKSWINKWNEEKGMNYIIIEKDSEKFVGMGSLSTYWNKGYGELGCWIRPKFWGNEYSKQRALALIELGFDTLDLNYIQVKFDKENKKCKRSVEKYMDIVNGKKTIEYNEVVGNKRRTTVKYIITNKDYSKISAIEDLTFSK